MRGPGRRIHMTGAAKAVQNSLPQNDPVRLADRSV